MRIGRFGFPTGAVGVALIGIGLALSIANFAVPGPAVGHFLGQFGTLMFWGGWAFLLGWLINGYRHRFTLRHTLRVGVWTLAGLSLTAAAFHVLSALSGTGLGAVSQEMLALFFAVSCAAVTGGWYEWRRNMDNAKQKGNSNYDDWIDVVEIIDRTNVDFDAD